jgi:hypothetical protein
MGAIVGVSLSNPRTQTWQILEVLHLCLRSHRRSAFTPAMPTPPPHTIAGDGLTFTHSLMHLPHGATHLTPTLSPSRPAPACSARRAGLEISRALGEIIYGDTSTSLYINLSVYIVLYKYIIKVNKYPILYVLYKFIDIYSLIQA